MPKCSHSPGSRAPAPHRCQKIDARRYSSASSSAGRLVRTRTAGSPATASSTRRRYSLPPASTPPASARRQPPASRGKIARRRTKARAISSCRLLPARSKRATDRTSFWRSPSGRRRAALDRREQPPIGRQAPAAADPLGGVLAVVEQRPVAVHVELAGRPALGKVADGDGDVGPRPHPLVHAVVDEHVEAAGGGAHRGERVGLAGRRQRRVRLRPSGVEPGQLDHLDGDAGKIDPVPAGELAGGDRPVGDQRHVAAVASAAASRQPYFWPPPTRCSAWS